MVPRQHSDPRSLRGLQFAKRPQGRGGRSPHRPRRPPRVYRGARPGDARGGAEDGTGRLLRGDPQRLLPDVARRLQREGGAHPGLGHTLPGHQQALPAAQQPKVQTGAGRRHRPEKYLRAAYGPPEMWTKCPDLFMCNGSWPSKVGDDVYSAPVDMEKARRLWNEAVEESGFTGKIVLLTNTDFADFYAAALITRTSWSSWGPRWSLWLRTGPASYPARLVTCAKNPLREAGTSTRAGVRPGTRSRTHGWAGLERGLAERGGTGTDRAVRLFGVARGGPRYRRRAPEDLLVRGSRRHTVRHVQLPGGDAPRRPRLHSP